MDRKSKFSKQRARKARNKRRIIGGVVLLRLRESFYLQDIRIMLQKFCG